MKKLNSFCYRLTLLVAVVSMCVLQLEAMPLMSISKNQIRVEPDGKKKIKGNNANTQTANVGTTVTLMTTGTGNTKEEATKNALRDALEQTYGTFISANSHVVNDELVRDEIISLSSGNIVKYEVVSFIGSNPMQVTVEAVVSISNLITYAQNKGMAAELAGNTFAMNVKLEDLNRQNQKKAIKNLLRQAELMSKNLFDYEIKIGEPRQVGNSDKAIVPIEVMVKPNENTLLFYDMLHSTLKKLSQRVIEGESRSFSAMIVSHGTRCPVIGYESSWVEESQVRDGNTGWPKLIRKENYISYILKEKMVSGIISEGSGELRRESDYWYDMQAKMKPLSLCEDAVWNFTIIDNLGNTFDKSNKSSKFTRTNFTSNIYSKKDIYIQGDWLGLPKHILANQKALYKIDFTVSYTMNEISRITKIEVRPGRQTVSQGQRR